MVAQTQHRSPGLTIVKNAWVPDELTQRIRGYSPRTDLGRIVKECLSFLPVDMAADLLDTITRSVVLESSLAVRVIRGEGGIEDYGVVSQKVITTAGVGFLVDAWGNTVELEIMRYHGIGTGSVAEAVGDTALGAELTTQYNPDNTRATGTLAEAAANIFQTVGTNTVDATVAITEHGILSQAATGGGVLWDRSVFAAINLVSGDSLAATYSMTASAGG